MRTRAPKRAGLLPGVPAMVETGLKGFEMTNWCGFMSPGRTPRDIVVKLNSEISRIVALPGQKAQFEPMSPGEFGKFLGNEIGKYAELVKASGINLEQ